MAVRFADRLRTAPRRSPEQAGAAWLAAGGAGALALAFVISPSQIENGPVVCPFRLLTGLPCPGCGLTRSWVFLAHGEWLDALRANPFGYVTVAATVVLIAAVLAALVRGRPLPSMSRVARSKPLWAVVIVWLAFAAVRIAVIATT